MGKVKRKLDPVLNQFSTEPLKPMGKWRYRSIMLDLGMEASGQLHAPVVLPSEKIPRYPLDRRLGGRQSRSERCGEKKNLLPLPGIGPRPFSS
jgi:hypothetical protein